MSGWKNTSAGAITAAAPELFVTKSSPNLANRHSTSFPHSDSSFLLITMKTNRPTSIPRVQTLFQAFALLLALALAPATFAQVVSAGMTGYVGDKSGKPVAGATVTATHAPTGTAYSATTRADGRFNFRGMIVGGPYNVSVASSGFKSDGRSEINTILGQDISQDFTLESGSEVLTLEAFKVSAGANDLDGTATGAGNVFSSQRIGAKPTSERSLADMISASPLVTIRSFGGDREEAQITAVGQNNRYNSIQIDGARINDQFGLNSTGLASFFNPLSLDTIEQLSVQVSPYDVRQAGFTGASINAVTKSGTNTYKGSVYYYFRGNELLGQKLQGQNVRENVLTGANVVPKLERQTYGITFGGPILKNRLFFFLNYEKFESTSAGRDQRLGGADYSAITARYAAYNTASGKNIAWGAPVSSATTNASEDEKKIAKIDWNISSNHRASIRYSSTEGEVPQFGYYASGSFNNFLTLSGGPVGALQGHFYAQLRKEESYAGQLFSQWTPDFKTEIKYSTTIQDQFTPSQSTAPMVAIYGVAGRDLTNGNTVTNGAVIAGTEQFRHGNQINVETSQMSVTGDYFLNNFVFSGGFEREQNDFYNLFRQGSYGLVAFRSVADFLNDVPTRIQRNYYDPKLRPVADVSDFATNGIFGQVKWDINPRLNVQFGVRYEFAESELRPALNQTFLTTTGFRNDGTLDGSSQISPRLSFNWAADEARITQIRGGIGHFSGRAPWVLFSNSFGATGVGSFTRTSADAVNPIPLSFASYLRNDFDPANPIGSAADSSGARREVALSDDGINLPSVWRANLAVDRKIPLFDTVLSLEVVQSYNDQSIFISNENLRKTTVGADGRQRFGGNPASNTVNPRFADYTNIYRIRNVSNVGESRYFTASWSRPLKNNWGFDASYVRGFSTDAQAIGQTTASGQWERNVVFNQSEVERGISDFEIKNRVMLSYTRQFEFVKKWKTTASLYYEGRSGNPYSWVYNNSDLNGDGRNDNDIMAVPSGLADPRFDFSGLSAADAQTYLDRINSNGLGEYAGGISGRNAFQEPWVNRLDLKLMQNVPIYGNAKLDLFFDFINFGSFLSRDFFGYYEEATLQSNDVFRRRNLGGASYGADGRIRPTLGNPSNLVIDNGQSRWRIQLGAKLSF